MTLLTRAAFLTRILFGLAACIPANAGIIVGAPGDNGTGYCAPMGCYLGLAAGSPTAYQVQQVDSSDFTLSGEPAACHATAAFRHAAEVPHMDSATAIRLNNPARSQPNAHLLLGVQYAQASLVDDARRELTEASRLDPGRTQTLQLLQHLSVRH